MMRWTNDMDETLLYMRDYLQMSFEACASFLRQEFQNSEFSKNSALGRFRTLKANGITYEPLEVERV